MSFAPDAFLALLMQDLREAAKPVIEEAGADGQELARRMLELELEHGRTFLALALATDPVAIVELHEALERDLPQWRDSLLHAIPPLAGLTARAALEEALRVFVRALVVAAKAFVPSPT